jgi:hypothetical protein
MAFWTLGALLGLTQAWVSRMEIVNDTISYLDMGDYFFHGHPAAIINGIWSPLYAFLLGAALAIFKPSLYMEYPVVHLLLFVIFLFTLGCFDFFLRQLVRLCGGSSPENLAPQSDWPWIAIAYTVFLWSSLSLIGVYETNPDMLVAAFFYLSCGLLVKISTGQATWKTFLGLGVTLGLSYLTKGVMFPLSLVLLATAWLAARRKFRYILVSLTAFLIIAAPFIVALSVQKGHITVGESGNYNYAVHVNGIAFHHWQGDTDTADVPVHPTREVFFSPATFEFKGPLPGTYPVWYDPTFWYEGVKPHFHVREQIKAVSKNLFDEFETIFYALNGILFATLFLAFYEAKEKFPIFENVSRCWFLIAPSALGVGLYALVHFETRYAGPFFAVLGVCFFSSILWADGFPKRRFFSGIAVLQLGMLLWLVAMPWVFHLRHPWTSDKGSYQDVAAGAVKMGLHPGDQIASLNFSNLGTAMWARLARIHIIAEVYYWPGNREGAANCFWNADPATQEKVLQRLSETGAKAVVSSDVPTGPGAARWSRIGNTGYYLLWLNSATLASQGTLPGDSHSN